MSLNGSPKWMYNAGAEFYPYKINQSLRFNAADSSYLEKTFSSTGNAKTFTISFWVKRGRDDTAEYLFAGGSTVNDRFHMDINASGTYQIEAKNGGSTVIKMEGGPRLRDNSAWYHFVLRVDTTQGTAANRVRLYNNGNLVTFNSNTYPSQNTNLQWNVNSQVRIGRAGWATSYYDGYMAEFQNVDGLSLDPTYFGETKENVWIPKEYDGSYGTNGFYLKYVAGAEGTDSSGNGNNFTHTPGNTSRNRAVQDSPTNNFCVMPYSNNPTILAKEHQGMRLNTTRTGYWDGAYGSFSVKSGKWYYEVQMNETAGDAFRVVPGWKNAPEEDTKVFNRLGISADPFGTSNTGDFGNLGHYAFPPWNATFFGNGGYTGTKSAASKGDVLNVAVDFDNNKIYFGINGTYQANDGGTDGDPANGTNESLSGLLNNGKFYSPSVCLRNDNNAGSNHARFNFGSDRSFGANLSLGTAYADENGFGEFRYSVPSGFLALCSENLPNPEVDHNDGENPTDYFNTVLYTGDGTTSKSVTGVGFQPDWVWIKARSQGYRHNFFDVIRGAGNMIEPSYANDEANSGTSVGTSVQPSFISDGFTVGVPSSGTYNGNLGTNENTTTFVSWNWKAGGSPSNNSNGSITSSVSVNTDAGLSIVSYTGTGSAATIGHGLSQAAEYVIVKNRDVNGDNWAVGASTANIFANHLQLNRSADGATSAAQVFGGVNATSTVFSVGTNHKTNASGEKYIAYCFHSVDGFSKIGNYIGNSNADGPTINCGFRPAWVLIRRTVGGSDWCIYDSKRLGFNVDNNLMRIGQSSAPTEQTDDDIDFYSTGFKLRRSSTNFNSSGNTHVFLAFSEQAFKYANAR